jgi:polyhydroxybutyrate depolymerase
MKATLRALLIALPLLWAILAAPGCAPVGAGRADSTRPERANAGDHIRTVRVGGVERRYIVHVPPGYDGRSPVPVVIMLHGGGGTGKAAAIETGWGAKADGEVFLAVFPEAMPPDPTKPGSFARNPQLWNDGSDRFHEGQKAPDDVGFLRAMLDDLISRFAVDPKRVYVTGFSNGASMCFRAAAELSDRIAAIAPVAGALWLDPVVLERPVPMLYITGTEDPLNLIGGGVPRLATGGSDKIRAKPKPPVRDTVMRWGQALGCPSRPRETSEANGVRTEIYGPGRGGAEVVYVTVEGLGHTWAGGRSLLPEAWVGKTSDKIDATSVIWEFFKQHASRGMHRHDQGNEAHCRVRGFA